MKIIRGGKPIVFTNGKRDLRYWWISPYFFIGFNLIILFISFTRNENYYLMYGVKKYIDIKYIVVVLASFLFFCLGTMTTGYKRKRYEYKNTSSILNYTVLLVYLTYFGYLIWAINFISIYGLGAKFTSLSVYHYNSGSIDGLTTCTQFGVIACPCLMLQIKDGVEKKKNIIRLIILFLLSIIRAYLFSERLAILELIVTSGIVYILAFPQKRKIAIYPILALIAIFVLFGAFEFYRSWPYYSDLYDSFADFVIGRITAYYNLATNTNAMYLQYINGSYFPEFSIQFLTKLPGLNFISWYSVKYAKNIFNVFADPEFNNPGGMAALFLDFNILSFAILFVLGRYVKYSYNEVRNGSVFHIIVYSLIFLTFIELPRYFYLGQTRAFYPILALIALKLVIDGKIRIPRLVLR